MPYAPIVRFSRKDLVRRSLKHTVSGGAESPPPFLCEGRDGLMRVCRRKRSCEAGHCANASKWQIGVQASVICGNECNHVVLGDGRNSALLGRVVTGVCCNSPTDNGC